jgi:hypothetical protein
MFLESSTHMIESRKIQHHHNVWRRSGCFASQNVRNRFSIPLVILNCLEISKEDTHLSCLRFGSSIATIKSFTLLDNALQVLLPIWYILGCARNLYRSASFLHGFHIAHKMQYWTGYRHTPCVSWCLIVQNRGHLFAPQNFPNWTKHWLKSQPRYPKEKL